jgi:MFS family permease
LLFVLGSFFLAESPRWLFRRGNAEAARKALLRSRTETQAEIELKEMAETIAAEKNKSAHAQLKESLLRRKYVIPFLLACVILACNQATGVNSVIGYNTTILIQAGLDDRPAHFASTLFTLINFLATIVAVVLVDRKGRKFLLSLGTGGVIISAICAALLFHKTEKLRVNVGSQLQQMVSTNQTLSLAFNAETATRLLGGNTSPGPKTLVVIYSYGDFSGATPAVRSDVVATPITISRGDCVTTNKVVAFFSNPLASVDVAKTAPLKIDAALITPVPDAASGWWMAAVLCLYITFFAVGPGVCVWLALSELMPTRIRSNGMSIALVLNQAVATIIAIVFLPTVGKYGYATMFFVFAGCTVVYFLTAAFFLPETKGKTLEEIEEHFEGAKAK